VPASRSLIGASSLSRRAPVVCCHVGRQVRSSSAGAGEWACKSRQPGGEGGADVLRIGVGQERQGHDHDGSAARPWDGSQLGTALTAGSDLAQAVDRAGVLIHGYSKREVPAALGNPPARLGVARNRIGKGRRPVIDSSRISE
jgi:hypothetical protein